MRRRGDAMARVLILLDRFVAGLIRIGGWLAVPIFLALFLQWPLRDLAQCCSRETNDAAQWIFALYVALALTAATRAHAHLRADSHARRYADATRIRIERIGMGLVFGGFAAMALVASWPMARDSFVSLERFADTSNPGYFLIKAAVPLMAGLALLQAAIRLFDKDGAP